MIPSENGAQTPAPIEEIQIGWHDLRLRVGQLEAEKVALEQENKALRSLLERSIEHRQKSHSELVLLLTGLVSKLPLNEVGVIVSRLVEHNTNVSQVSAALAKGTADAHLPQPIVLQTLEHTRHELTAALKPVVAELLELDVPLECDLLQGLLTEPEHFFSARMVRANRCFIKGHIPKERVVREFGPEALVFFNDVTTDPKLNPRPKPEEIALSFKTDFEALLEQNPILPPDKRQQMLALYRKVQRSKSPTEQARAQRNAFQKLSFLLELLYYYNHQNTEAPDVLFAQRLPALVEQLVAGGPDDKLEEKLIEVAQRLIGYVINPDHQQMIVNNLGKGGGSAKTLKYVLRLRNEKVPEVDQVVTEFLRHLLPARPQRPPPPQQLAEVLRLIHPDMQRLVLKALLRSERLKKEEAETLARDVASQLGIKNLEEAIKHAPVSPEIERQMAWARIKDLIAQRGDATALAEVIRDRLHAHYDADEIRQSWITLTEADPISLIRIFCHLPYLPTGNTDPVARAVMETYVTRLTHEKYAVVYNKIVKSLRSMYHAKPDSPTLLNFLALVRWISPEAATRMYTDVGMSAPG